MNIHIPKQIIVELHDERRAEELCQILTGKGFDVREITSFHYLGVRE